MNDLMALRTSIHMHTYASDGNGSIEDICRSATKEGIDCVIISDHDTLGHNYNGYAGPVLVLTGEEITPQYSERVTETGEVKGVSANSHLLTLGLAKAISNNGRTAQELIDLVSQAGGMSFLAHPEEPGHPWDQWDVGDYTGLEIWTYKAAWKAGAAQAPSKTYAWRNPDSVLGGPSELALQLWDRVGLQRRVVGLGCADQHGFNASIDGIDRPLFTWEIGLAGIVSYVWVDPILFKQDPVETFLGAIRRGQVIIAHDGLAPGRGFTVKAFDPHSAQVFWPGDELDPSPGICIQVESPITADIRILKDGTPVYEEHTRHLESPVIDAGVWRVEALLGGRPWVYANPFYVGGWEPKRGRIR